MKNQFNRETIFSLFTNWRNSTDNYPGAVYVSIYNKYPECFRLYFSRDHKLKYQNAVDELPEERKEANKVSISPRKLIRNLLKGKKTMPIDIFPYSPTEYIVIGDGSVKGGKDFVMFLVNADDGNAIAHFYEEIFCDPDDIDGVFNILKDCFEEAEKNKKVEFGIAAMSEGGYLYTSYYDYKVVDIDIDKNYNDDIPYDRIVNLVETDGESELILLYGDPGTGKTSLIKHLISKFIDKDFVFIDGTLLAHTSQEKLMAYMLENQDTVFILEDCEKALTSRDQAYNPVMPILLNITDGIIGDVLGIKLICTFNTSLRNIDPALLRKGRLSLKYEFKKLCKEKVRAILNDETINEDMTLADVYNYKEENDYSKKNSKRIGF